MNTPEIRVKDKFEYLSLMTRDDAYSRSNEEDDALFYQKPRLVQHLDSLALQTIESLIGTLVVESYPAILDLMAGFDSHLPQGAKTGRVVGLGLNREELQKNPRLDEFVIHDLNADPYLPFDDHSFDVVLNTASIQYLTNPAAIFREVARVLKPGGLFLVIFSNRMFFPKAVKMWTLLSESERLQVVNGYFAKAARFEAPQMFASIGKPRPADDKYADKGIPSDPVFAVYADKIGGDPLRKVRPHFILEYGEKHDGGELQKRFDSAAATHRCPHCGEPMKLWAISDNPYTTWDHDLYICVNDGCPYLVRGWDVMFEQGNPGISYRMSLDPQSGKCNPIPVPNLNVIKNDLRG